MNSQSTKRLPRILVTAARSGQGKTMITCGLLRILSRRTEMRAFKCGPDYIDPMFHSRVLGVPSHNLDSFLADENTLRYLLGRHGTDGYNRMAVLEGAMGYYDGLGGVSDRASAYDVARITKTPVIFIADGSGSSLSVIAGIKGFMEFRPDSHIEAVIFNRVSPMMYPRLKALAEQELGLKVVGYVPVLKDVSFESRHLGLVMPEEIEDFKERMDILADRIAPGLDLDLLCEIAAGAEPISWTPFAIPCLTGCTGLNGLTRQRKPVIAVAMDEAFCFYYQDNLEILQSMGAELRYFSPIHDREFPAGTDGLYLGGGYPELHARELSENGSMRNAVRRAVESGMPCIAECGGYLYLGKALWDPSGRRWPMAGIHEGEGKNAGKLVRFGYGTMEAERPGILGDAGKRLPVHEFHHWDCGWNGEDLTVKKPFGNQSWQEGYHREGLYAGFPHLYFYSDLSVPYGFLRRASQQSMITG